MTLKHQPSFLQLVVVCTLSSLFIQTVHGETLLRRSLNKDSPKCYQDFERKSAFCSGTGLTAIPQSLSREIEKLYADFNSITTLRNSSFQRYLDIKELVLSNNEITVVNQATFHPLKNLIHLDISFNFRIVLPASGLLRWCVELIDLRMSASLLASLPSDILHWSPHLRDAFFDGNNLTIIDITNCDKVKRVYFNAVPLFHITTKTFTFTCQTEYLNLGEIPIRSIEPEAIAPLRVRKLAVGHKLLTFDVLRNLFIGTSQSKIKELVVFDANMTVIPKDIFDSLRNFSFQLLDLSHNHVRIMYPNVFSNLTRLDQLLLFDNDIAMIEPKFFEGMQDLRILNLNNNKITEINPFGRTWNLALFELHLSGNLLAEILEDSLHGLRNLTFLDMSSNEDLATVEFTSFTELENIQTIDLSKCRIQALRLDTPTLKFLSLSNVVMFLYVGIRPFEQLRSLTYLNLSDSGLSARALWYEEDNTSIFEELRNLVTLDLRKNSFDNVSGDLHRGIFERLSILRELNLDSCYISNLPSLVFTGLESVQNLSLRGNQIQHLEYNIFDTVHQVITIDLYDNLLTYLHEDLFSNNPKLSHLILANNKLNRLDEGTFKPIESSLSSIDISFNPMVCICDIKWLPKWLKRETITVVNAEDTVCSSASLSPVREKPVLDFNPDELCKVNMALMCLIPLATICVVVTVILTYHNRWRLRYTLFLFKLAAVGYKEIRDARNHDDYEFDLNVIFYDDDEEWIREHLRPAIRERLPQFQRSVFGDEELVLGMHYLDSVDYVVSHSYKTIIVLSTAAVRDRWFMLKFRTAMDHVSDTQTEFVVVVFLEDIPDDDIPFLARLYLSDGRPYIFWPDDIRGHEYFWNELTKNLTINLKTNDLIPNE